MTEHRRPGARAALALAADSGTFLSTVQIGITLVAIFTGVFSGAAAASAVAIVLEHIGVPRAFSSPAGYGATLGTVTILSVVFGELVPKKLALRAPERIACAVAPFMTRLSRLLTPLVRFLDACSSAVFNLLHLSTKAEAAVTDDEIHSVVAEAEQAGVIEPAERKMISGVMRLADRPVRGLMTPRTDVAWIDINAPESELRAVFTSTRHSLLPAGDGSIDASVGVVATQEVLGHFLAGGSGDIRSLVQHVPILTDGAGALEALKILREAARPIALVHDEYGHFEGLVTPNDVLQAIVGVFLPDQAGTRSGATAREDGSWDLAGWLPADEMAEHLGLTLPAERDYDTVAGFVLTGFPQLPEVGQQMTAGRWRFEVTKLQGRRVERLCVSPLPRDELSSPEV